MIVAIASYLGGLTALGCVVLRLLAPGMEDRALRLGLCVTGGAAAGGQLLLLASLCGIPPSRPLLAGLAALALAILHRLPAPAPREERGRERLPLGVLAIGVAVSAAVWVASTLPPEWDGFAIWLLKAKLLWLEALSPLPDYFSDPALSYSHLDYPPLLPLLVAGMHAAVGEADALAAHAVSAYLLLGLGCVCFGAMRPWLGDAGAAALTLACLASPAFLRWAAAPLADVPLAAFHLASVVIVCRLLHGVADPREIVLAGLLGAAAALTKLEGQPLAVLACLSMLAVGIACRAVRGARMALILAGVQVVLLLPWLSLAARLPRWHENYAGHLSAVLDPARLGRLWQDILPALGAQLAIGGRWGALWVLPLLLVLPACRSPRDPAAVFMWCLCLSHLALYLLAYVITPWDVQVLLQMTLERLLLHLAPVVMLLAGLHAAASLPANQRKLPVPVSAA